MPLGHYQVQALQVIYTSLNSPPHLTGWIGSGGDPCAESWKGVTCEGEVSELGLNGTMGYALSSFVSLKNINMAKNILTGNLPYSISTMASLNYLNMSHNLLAQAMGDVFTNLTTLGTLVVKK